MAKKKSTGDPPSAPPRRACYPVAEAAALTGLSTRFLWNLMGDGTLPYIRIGRTRRISAEALQALIDRHTVGAR